MTVKAVLQRFTENSADLRFNEVNIEPESIRAIMINEVLPTDSDDVSYNQ